MSEQSIKKIEQGQIIADTARQLLAEGLLVRTWGNLSCRFSQNEMLITPSGRAYETMQAEDLPVMNIESGEWQGPHKPSGERGAHVVAYKVFPDANFVIHTHQAYASAFSVSGIEKLEISKEENEALGGLALADYGLPGTKKLTQSIEKAMAGGAHTVLMAKHGVIIAAENREQAVSRAKLLEEICKRGIKGFNPTIEQSESNTEIINDVLPQLKKDFTYVQCVSDSVVISQANSSCPIHAQLDDMAQMIGSTVPVERDYNKIVKALKRRNAVLVPGIGGFVSGIDQGDTDALAALLSKSAIAALHTKALGLKNRLSLFDCTLMHAVYVNKYSKQKK